MDGHRGVDDVVARQLPLGSGGLFDRRGRVVLRSDSEYSTCAPRKASSSRWKRTVAAGSGRVEVSTEASAVISIDSCGRRMPNASTRVPHASTNENTRAFGVMLTR
ncbi:MAG: hypothetical protein R2704_04525 [Microthrixaceae bacterium]